MPENSDITFARSWMNDMPLYRILALIQPSTISSDELQSRAAPTDKKNDCPHADEHANVHEVHRNGG